MSGIIRGDRSEALAPYDAGHTPARARALPSAQVRTGLKRFRMGGQAMADKEQRPGEKTPLAQAFFDNIFLLLVLGIAVPVIFYTIWGLFEIASIPVGK